MPYYYDLRIVRWLTSRTRKKKLDAQKVNIARPRYSLASLMCLDRSHIQDETLRHAVWYQANLPREIALEILQQEEVGAFVVRDSTTHPGCYALSVRVPRFENASGISHYLIMRTQRGVKLKGLDKEWSTLAALVTHHTVMREMLPCTLKLPKIKSSPAPPSPSASNITSSNHAPVSPKQTPFTTRDNTSLSPKHLPFSSPSANISSSPNQWSKPGTGNIQTSPKHQFSSRGKVTTSSVSPEHGPAPFPLNHALGAPISPPIRQDTRYTRTSVTKTTTTNKGWGRPLSTSDMLHTAAMSSCSVVNDYGASGRRSVFEPQSGVLGREAGVMYTDNYSHLSEMSEFVGQLQL